MADAPTPIYIEPKMLKINKPVESTQTKILDKKDYELKYDNNLYNLEIKFDSNYIYFRIYENKDNNIQPIFYKNKFDLKTITYNLKLYPEIYNSLDKVFSLINDSYNSNKIKLSIKDNLMNIIIKVVNGNIEIDCPINLKETKLEIDEKFEMVISDINILKKNINNLTNKKILEIENIIKDVQILTNRKLEENENKIKELSYKVDKYKSQFEQNENNIKSLKNELLEIKKLINKNNSIYNNESNNIIIEDKNDKNNSHNSDKNNNLINNNKQENNDSSYDNNLYEEYETPQEESSIKNEKIQIIRNNTSKTEFSKDNNNYSSLDEEKKLDKNLKIEENKENMLHKSFRADSYFSENNKKNNSILLDDNFSNFNKRGSYISFGLISKKSGNLQMEHSKRKLSCIIKDINEPITQIIDIPRFKIFKGFQKKIK